MDERVIPQEELKKIWDNFSKLFQIYMEPSTIITSQTLISFSGIGTFKEKESTNGFHICEVGCGGGGSSLAFKTFSNHKDTKLTCTDLSPKMIEIAKERVNEKFGNNHSISFVETPSHQLPFKDNALDGVISNYCLHLVPDVNESLNEIFRVLKPGGTLAFSVWGRKENSPKFRIMNEIFQKYEQKDETTNKSSSSLPTQRSNFHLSNLEELKSKVLKVGFKTCLAWYQKEPMYCLNENEFTRVLSEGSPKANQMLSQLSLKEQELFKNDLSKLSIESSFKNNHPIHNEVLIIVATK